MLGVQREPSTLIFSMCWVTFCPFQPGGRFPLCRCPQKSYIIFNQPLISTSLTFTNELGVIWWEWCFSPSLRKIKATLESEQEKTFHRYIPVPASGKQTSCIFGWIEVELCCGQGTRGTCWRWASILWLVRHSDLATGTKYLSLDYHIERPYIIEVLFALGISYWSTG